MTPRLVSRSSNSSAHALEVVERVQVVEQVGLAAHDQLAAFARRRPTSWQARPR